MMSKISKFYTKLGSVLCESTLEPEAKEKMFVPICMLLSIF